MKFDLKALYRQSRTDGCLSHLWLTWMDHHADVHSLIWDMWISDRLYFDQNSHLHALACKSFNFPPPVSSAGVPNRMIRPAILYRNIAFRRPRSEATPATAIRGWPHAAQRQSHNLGNLASRRMLTDRGRFQGARPARCSTQKCGPLRHAWKWLWNLWPDGSVRRLQIPPVWGIRQGNHVPSLL